MSLIEKLNSHLVLNKALKIIVEDEEPLEVYVTSIMCGVGTLEFTVRAVYKTKFDRSALPSSEEVCLKDHECKKCLDVLMNKIHTQ